MTAVPLLHNQWAEVRVECSLKQGLGSRETGRELEAVPAPQLGDAVQVRPQRTGGNLGGGAADGWAPPTSVVTMRKSGRLTSRSPSRLLSSRSWRNISSYMPRLDAAKSR